MNLAKVALSLVAVLALAGCSSFSAPSPCDPCAVAPQPVCDPCAPQPVCDPCAVQPVNTGSPRPPAANPGEVWCYIRIPAVTRTVEEQVCVQPETCRQEWVPPVTRDVCEQVCVVPERTETIPIPARYETVCEQVMVCPAKTEWRKVACEPHSLAEGEQLGECWTLTEIPPVYETRSRQVCVQPESCEQRVIPAQYETRTKTITEREGYYQSIPVPAVYETRCREELVCPARWEWRRTTECEIPELVCPPVAPGTAPPMPDPTLPGAPLPGTPMDDPMLPPGGPPAGELAPADPFAR
jgi:hypothetical protein